MSEKKSAREMITMVTGINKNNFRGNPEVSCYTCHRGATSVAHTLTVPLPYPRATTIACSIASGISATKSHR